MKTARLLGLAMGVAFPVLGFVPLPAQASLPVSFSAPSLVVVDRDASVMPPASSFAATELTLDTPHQEATLAEVVQELRRLPVGKDCDYYLRVLEQRGYLILMHLTDEHQWEFEVEKTQQVARLAIAYNSGTHTSTQLTASGRRIA